MSEPKITIVSNDDDSVTLQVEGIHAHITGPDWHAANHAAHMLGALVAGKAKAQDVLGRVRSMAYQLDELGRSLDSAEYHLRGVVEGIRP